MLTRQRLSIAGLTALVLAGAVLAWLVRDAPLAPGLARGWLQVDALSALSLIALGAQGLATHVAAPPGRRGDLLAAGLLALAAMTGHLAIVGGLLIAGVAALGGRRWPPSPALPGALLAALGLALVGLTAGEWRYSAPTAGTGLSSVSFALLLLGALLAADAPAVARGRAPAAPPLAAVACLSALLRLFSLGPWNLGWLFAAIVAGGGLALGTAWQAAAAPPEQAGAWLGAYLAGLAIAGAGLGSGAGVTLAGYALLIWPIMRLGLADANGPRRPLWLLTGAVPLTAPFMLTWMAVAAATAGGLTMLAAAFWVAALLAAAPVVRLAAGAAARPRGLENPAVRPAAGGRPGEPGEEVVGMQPAERRGAWVRPGHLAAALSAALGLGAPLVVAGLLGPLAAQLQGGLTPFGELSLWPWAGLIALDAARQPVATMPSVALAALMLILAALCWVALRLWQRAGHG